MDKTKRLQNARLALEGLSIGDAFGDQFFLHEDDAIQKIESRELPVGKWKYTDDTLMALSIYHVLTEYGEINQDALAESFVKHLDKSRGYGAGALRQLLDMQQGNDWRKLSRDRYGGMGSAGNGSAMRVAPIGAYYCDDIERVVEQAKLSSEVTHSNDEAIAGSIVVAVATAIACRYHDKSEPTPNEFLREVIDYIPDSEVRAKVQVAVTLPNSASVRLAVSALGNGSKLLAVDTIPFSIWCASRSLDNFEDAMWMAVSGLGDRDTNCAIVGGIVLSCVGLEGLPEQWIQSREQLPDWIEHYV